jgi:hypothetical protein
MTESPLHVAEGLTPDEERVAREILPKLRGRLSRELFEIFQKIIVGIAVEAVFYRKHEGRIQVLLVRRPPKDEDPTYGDRLAVVGTMVRTSDVLPPDHPEAHSNPYLRPFERIKEEVGIAEFGAVPRIVDTRLWAGDRGPVNQIVTLCTVPENLSPRGSWYDADQLPADIVGEHVSLIALALRHVR